MSKTNQQTHELRYLQMKILSLEAEIRSCQREAMVTPYARVKQVLELVVEKYSEQIQSLKEELYEKRRQQFE